MIATLAAAEKDSIQKYIEAVSNGLTGIEKAEKQDILAEISSHLSDRIDGLRRHGVTNPVEQAISALGDPAGLASQFVAVACQQRASRSYAPWVLLRAAARIASTGAKGMLVFLVGLIGYVAALGFLLTAILKLLIPKMGLWAGSWGLVWGVKSDTMAGRELLGQYFIPVSVVLSFVFGSGCTLLLQRLTRPSRSVLNR